MTLESGNKAGRKSVQCAVYFLPVCLRSLRLFLQLSGQLPLSQAGDTAPLKHLNQGSARFDPRRENDTM